MGREGSQGGAAIRGWQSQVTGLAAALCSPGAVGLYRVRGRGSGLPVQGGEEAAGRQQDGALGEAVAPLAHPLQVPLGEVSHADGPCRAI